MNLIINGKNVEIGEQEVTIIKLLELRNVESPDMVSVQINGEIVERDSFKSATIKEGDEIEFLYFMGGGSGLNNDQIIRYSRHILLKGVGGAGQERLLNSKVLVIGAGGLGAPISLYLAAAGVGTIGIIDSDQLDLSNLQRQVIYVTSDVERPKVLAAKERLRQLNPDVTVNTYQYRLDVNNILQTIADYDFIIEGTDNFPTKFLVNDACILADKPFNQGGILRFKGQTMTHIPGSASYRCVYRQPPPPGSVPTCSEAGVLGAIAGMLGTIQAGEALKYLLGIGELLINRVLMFDALAAEFRTVSVKPTEYAKVAAENKKITELIEYEQPVCDIEAEIENRKTLQRAAI